jgi:hypothetical protein
LELFPFWVQLVESGDDGSITGAVARVIAFGPKATAQTVLDSVVGGEGENATARLWMWQEPPEAPKEKPKATVVTQPGRLLDKAERHSFTHSHHLHHINDSL